MTSSRSAVRGLYTRGIDRYSAFVTAFQAPQGIQALLLSSHVLRPGLRVLDAGRGYGVASLALAEALRQKQLDYKCIDAFDLTPAMLSRFQNTVTARNLTAVRDPHSGARGGAAPRGDAPA